MAVLSFGAGLWLALLHQVWEAGGRKGIKEHQRALLVLGAPFLLYGLSPDMIGGLIPFAVFLIPLYFLILYKGRMTAPLGENALLSLDLVFWYAFLTRHDLRSGLSQALACLLALPSIYIVALAVAQVRPGKAGRVLALCCHFVYSAILAFWQMKGSLFPGLRQALQGNPVGFLELFFGGLFAGTLSLNLGYLILLFLETQGDKRRKRLPQLGPDLATSLAGRFRSDRIPARLALILTILQAGLLLANRRFGLIPEGIALNLVLTLFRWLPQGPQAEGA